MKKNNKITEKQGDIIYPVKKILLASLIVIASVFIVRFIMGGSEDDWVCQYGEWVKHGNPGSPKPEGGCGSQLVEKTKTQLEDSSLCYSPNGNSMTYEAAKEKAEFGCKEGALKETHFCNDSTGTWWIDFSPDILKEGCNPACVIFVDTGETEINRRCTGLN